MAKRVLDVGNCVPDHAAIRALVERNFDARVVQTHGPEDTLRELRDARYDLVLVTRKLDRDYSDGLDVIRAIKADPALAGVPVMLVTNYEEHQQAAIDEGAERGFGKGHLRAPETAELLRPFLT